MVFDDPQVLHADDDLLVAVKPAGLPTVPGRPIELHDCLYSRLLRQWPDVRVVHRLDMPTSGLVVFARHAAAQALLSRAFAERRVVKRYRAWVSGPWHHGRCGRIALPLAADWPNRPLQKVCAQTGKPSVTRWCQVGADAQPRVPLMLWPRTGRTHQLRVHLQALGHPIVGDTLYGGAVAARLMLHAERLTLAHPRTGVRMRFEQGPAADWGPGDAETDAEA